MTYRDITIRVPAYAVKPTRRGSHWSAAADQSGPSTMDTLEATGKTQAEATRNLTELVGRALAAACEQPTVVIGGGPDYETCIHLVLATAHGYDVHVIRDGRRSAAWSGQGKSMKEAVDGVLRHVGGNPTVVQL